MQEQLEPVDSVGTYTLESLEINLEALYKEMHTLEVQLNMAVVPDITYVNTKTIEIREASQKALRIYLKIQRALSLSQKSYANLEASYEILASSKLENDAEVKAGQSIQERQAIVSNKLVHYKRAMRDAKNNVETLKALNKAIDMCIKGIDKTDASLRQQVTIMNSQMRNLKTTDVGSAARDAYLRRTEDDMAELESLERSYSEDASSIEDSQVTVGTEDSIDISVEDPVDTEAAEETTEVVEEGVILADEVPIESPAVEESPISLTLSDDEEEITIAPGLTGALDSTDEIQVDIEDAEVVITADDNGNSDDLNSFLDAIPEVSSRKDAVLTTAIYQDSSPEETIDTSDDILDIDSSLEFSDSTEDLGESQVVPIDDVDAFGGLIDTAVVTEQKPPKLVREELAKQEEAAKAPAAAKTSQKTKAIASAPKKEVPSAPAVTSTPASEEDSLDQLISDLGL